MIHGEAGAKMGDDTCRLMQDRLDNSSKKHLIMVSHKRYILMRNDCRKAWPIYPRRAPPPFCYFPSVFARFPCVIFSLFVLRRNFLANYHHHPYFSGQKLNAVDSENGNSKTRNRKKRKMTKKTKNNKRISPGNPI